MPERSGLPTVGLLPGIYVRPTPGHPVMGSGAMPATGPFGRLRDAVAPRALLWLLSFGLPQLNAVRADLGMAAGDPRTGPARTGTATVAAAASAPHAHLLPQTAAVLTHAGHGSVLKALAAGVPLVCIPHGRDQGDNTARVLAAGAGVGLSRRAGPGAIRAALRRVLDDPSYRANAQRLAMVLDDEAQHRPDAVAEVLGVLRPAG